jgi:hypothetical protein
VAGVIQVSGIRKTYGKTVAIDEVSFEVNDGEIFGLIGPNGAGKTTTMECVEGLRTPERGTISVLGLDPFRDIYRLQDRIGVQLQQAQLQKRIKVWEIYREAGILKRLRATPLRPQTILTAHVVVKLVLTVVTLTVMMLAGKRYYPVDVDVPVFSFAIALLIGTGSILSIGFLIASIVPTARFAQPIGAVILYPMIGLSGLFVPVASLPPGLQALARLLPLTYVVSLLQGIWTGDAWSAHLGDVAALAAVSVVCTALSAKVFRWE